VFSLLTVTSANRGGTGPLSETAWGVEPGKASLVRGAAPGNDGLRTKLTHYETENASQKNSIVALEAQVEAADDVAKNDKVGGSNPAFDLLLTCALIKTARNASFFFQNCIYVLRERYFAHLSSFDCCGSCAFSLSAQIGALCPRKS